jgi:hypothetical protein
MDGGCPGSVAAPSHRHNLYRPVEQYFRIVRWYRIRNIAPSYEYSTHSIWSSSCTKHGQGIQSANIIHLHIIFIICTDIYQPAQRINYDQFGLAGLRADRVNGMCGIVSVAQHCTSTNRGVLHSTAPRVLFSLSFCIQVARRIAFDGQRRAQLGQRGNFLAG